MTDHRAKEFTLWLLDCTSTKRGLKPDWRFSKKRHGDYFPWNGEFPRAFVADYACVVVNPSYYGLITITP